MEPPPKSTPGCFGNWRLSFPSVPVPVLLSLRFFAVLCCARAHSLTCTLCNAPKATLAQVQVTVQSAQRSARPFQTLTPCGLTLSFLFARSLASLFPFSSPTNVLLFASPSIILLLLFPITFFFIHSCIKIYLIYILFSLSLCPRLLRSLLPRRLTPFKPSPSLL